MGTGTDRSNSNKKLTEEQKERFERLEEQRKKREKERNRK